MATQRSRIACLAATFRSLFTGRYSGMRLRHFDSAGFTRCTQERMGASGEPGARPDCTLDPRLQPLPFFWAVSATRAISPVPTRPRWSCTSSHPHGPHAPPSPSAPGAAIPTPRPRSTLSLPSIRKKARPSRRSARRGRGTAGGHRRLPHHRRRVSPELQAAPRPVHLPPSCGRLAVYHGIRGDATSPSATSIAPGCAAQGTASSQARRFRTWAWPLKTVRWTGAFNRSVSGPYRPRAAISPVPTCGRDGLHYWR